jgi:hypothetical protein
MGELHGISITIVPLTTPQHAPCLMSAVVLEMLIVDFAAEPIAGFVYTVVRGFQISMVAQLLKKTATLRMEKDGAWEQNMAAWGARQAGQDMGLIRNVAYIMFVMTEICSNVL